MIARLLFRRFFSDPFENILPCGGAKIIDAGEGFQY